MGSLQLQIMLIACIVSVACALPGVFLVLRGSALMSDAISHAILPGIVLMFLCVRQLQSPLLVVGAACAGMAIVVLTEQIIRTQRLKKDAAIGLLYPFFFSIGVILISRYARNVHLDVDMVFLGEIAFAPFNRLTLWGIDVGPCALWSMGAILMLNALFVCVLYKELTLATFDATAARLLGFSPALVHYSLMLLTSITAVGAFDAVGSLVVVALMIAPPATAYLLVNRVSHMVWLSVAFALAAALSGYLFAYACDVSIAGSIALMSGVFFVGALCYSMNKTHALLSRGL